MRLTLSVRNASALQANFRAFDRVLQTDVRAAVQKSGARTLRILRELCPVDTGYMRAHAKTVYSPEGMAFETGWDAQDFLGQGLAFYPFFQEYGTRFMPAQPSLTPAYERTRPEVERDIREAVKASVARMNAAGARAQGR